MPDLSRIPDAFYRRFPASREHPCWFYFDEIQNVPGWESFVRRLLDTEKISLVLTAVEKGRGEDRPPERRRGR
jgi:predicted AAA+ superfamily ATPase